MAAASKLTREQTAYVVAHLQALVAREGSQRAVARLLNCHVAQVSDVLAGKVGVGPKTLTSLSSVLGDEFSVGLANLAPTEEGVRVTTPDRYHFADEVVSQLVEDGMCASREEAGRIVGGIMFKETPWGTTPMDLYRAAVRAVIRERRPHKVTGERSITPPDVE